MFCGLITGLPRPWVGWAHGGVCSVCGRAQWPWRILRTAGVAGVRGYFWARVRWVLGSSGVGAFCVRARVFLFVLRWIVPLCLILTAFFPPSPERAETLRRNLLFEGTMLMPSDLGLCYFMRGP